jgi:hypothetical protein
VKSSATGGSFLPPSRICEKSRGTTGLISRLIASFSASASGQSIRRNDRDPLPGLDYGDLCIEIIQRKIGLIRDASFSEVPVASRPAPQKPASILERRAYYAALAWTGTGG